MGRRSLPGHSWSLPLAVALLGCVVRPAAPARAQAVDEDFWIPNGQVTAMARSGSTLYIAGAFTQIGPATGSGVPIDAASALPVVGFPKVIGQVTAVVPDGAGGWFIGGNFTSIDGVARVNLAHLSSNTVVSPWNPGADGPVYALAASGATVYVGGQFATAGGQPRNNIAAIDGVSGAATAWNPGADARVHALVVDGATVYAAGQFGAIGGATRFSLAALSVASGAATSWDPSPNGHVLAIAVSGATVYAGGAFTTIGGASRGRIAALSAASGAATPWNPGADADVLALAATGTTVYAGGYFFNIGGAGRTHVAAVDATTGSATAFDAGADNLILDLEVSGGTLYACGYFTTLGGQTRNYMAALDATTGAAQAWNPNAGGIVEALAVSGSTIYAGGLFGSVGGVARGRLAAIDLATGMPNAWNPNANPSAIYALAVHGAAVYVGGDFTTVGGAARNHIAALDATTGNATAWNPGCSGVPLAFAFSGNTVYVAGSFATIGGSTRANIAALDATTGTPTAWNPGISGGDAYAVAVSGPTVYAGGVFTAAGGQPRNGIAALDATTGLATAWNPNAGLGGWVQALVVSGPAVYAGGGFTAIGGQPRSNLAALDATTGLATAWDPDVDANVRSLALGGTTLYVGGNFSFVGPEFRVNVAAIDVATGLARPWNPSAFGAPWAIEVNGARIYAGGLFSVFGGVPQSALASVAAAPVVTALLPAGGGNLGPLTVAVAGSGLPDGATIRLTRGGQPQIDAGAVVVRGDGLGLDADFDLAGAEAGAWNFILTTPDLQTVTLTDGFTVEAAAPHELRVEVLGPALVRPNRARAFDVAIENLGNGDVLDVPLWISRLPATATIVPDFPVAAPPSGGGEPDWSAAPLTFDGPAGKYLALVIPRLPPGTTVRRFYVTVPGSVTSFEVDAALAPPWANPLGDCLANGGVTAAPSCVDGQLGAIHAALAATPAVEALNGIGVWAKVGWQCEGAASLPAALAESEQALDHMLQAIESGVPPAGCAVALTPRWQSRRPVTVVSSLDPNDKIGPIGTGPGRLIGSAQLLPYSIRFENLETATAPAQEVVVLDVLDATRLELSTLSLGPITFGNKTIYPPPGLGAFATDVDLRPSSDLIVRVGVGFDVATGVLSWSMTSIDPTTGALPDDPLTGFLPPNLVPPQGEGSMLFTVMPKSSVGGGTSIGNKATIYFDGVPLETPEWSNLMDTTAPASTVLPLAPQQDSVSFTVRWDVEGAPPPDLRDYSVYVSEGGQPFRPWRLHVAATADTFRAPGGQTYAFYSLARDSSGNLEPVPPMADVETYSVAAVAEATAPRFALEGVAPNPATGEAARVWFTLPNAARATLEVVDVAGRRVLRREVDALGPGRHSVDVRAATRASGLYFVRLAQGGRTLHARMAVIR